MPLYGQATETNHRLSALLSSVVANTNKLYDGIDYPVTLKQRPPESTKNLFVRIERPLFTDAILRKATSLQNIRKLAYQKPMAKTVSTIVFLQIVLVVDDHTEHNKQSLRLADLIAHLFALPDDQVTDVRLEVCVARSHAIGEDLAAAASSRPQPPGDSLGAAVVEIRQIFVGLGSALQGLSLFLCQNEVMRRLLLPSSTKHKTKVSTKTSILAVACIDPPYHLWKSCGKSILEYTSRHRLSSLFVGYTNHNNNKKEHISKGLGKVLGGCSKHPLALVLVAKESARLLGSSTNKDQQQQHELDVSVWLARLIIKYAEALQRIQTPPKGPSSGTNFGERSRL